MKLMLNTCMCLYNRKEKEMEEEICNPVSAMCEEQAAEETYPGAEHRLCSTTMHPVPHEHPSAPHEAARSLTEKQLQQLESSSSSHWQHFQHCKQWLPELSPLMLQWKMSRNKERLSQIFPEALG